MAGAAHSLAKPTISTLVVPSYKRLMSAIEYDIRRLERRLDRLKWATSTRTGIRILELPTARVRVRIAGRGHRTVVFACDMPNVVESYDEIIRLLGDDHRVLCWEQPGFGFSYPKAGFGFTLRDYIGVMAGMLRTLDLGPYTIVSPCQNVFQALAIAAENPELVERLVLMQAVRWRDMRRFADWAIGRFVLAGAFIPVLGKQIVQTPYLGQMLWAVMERNIARRTHPHVIYRASERPERFRQISEPLYAAHDHGACACFASGFQRYYSEEIKIPPVSQPALVLWATADRGHVGSDPKALLEYVPHAKWIAIPETGHHLELENPEAVVRAIRELQS
jgi:pimeloyl-ACP methyl ester carboxylesterase